jgi:hypothetical protein
MRDARTMKDAPSEDETIPDNDDDVDEKRMMFIGIGAVGIILGIFLSAIWGGFDVVDEIRSENWPETDVLSVEQDLEADEHSYVFFFHYEVDGEQYNSSFECQYEISQSASGQNDALDLFPWNTQCLTGSQDYLDMESIAYNPDDPSEIDVYPGFTLQAMMYIHGPSLSPLVLSYIGCVTLMRGLKGPEYGWVWVGRHSGTEGPK